jgi:hypothetical protein
MRTQRHFLNILPRFPQMSPKQRNQAQSRKWITPNPSDYSITRLLDRKIISLGQMKSPSDAPSSQLTQTRSQLTKTPTSNHPLTTPQNSNLPKPPHNSPKPPHQTSNVPPSPKTTPFFRKGGETPQKQKNGRAKLCRFERDQPAIRRLTNINTCRPCRPCRPYHRPALQAPCLP